ncbi:MAG: HD domain-containing phosphohydrolase [Lachnospiraceae bacterium]|nr:HD domain-containing phosphohydrolase [Lachnospiraceae bacterium]
MLSYDKYDIETPVWTTLDEALDHGVIVSNLAYLVSKELQMDEEFCHDMAVAGMVHDIGKLKIYSYLLQKYDQILAIDEARYIRMHPSTGYAVLKEQGFNDRILSAVLSHHENYDGSGYPNNLKGTDIPLEGRILHVCDCFGALISNGSSTDDFDLDSANHVMIGEVKNFDMRVYLTFQNLVFGEKFQKLLRDFGIK